MYSFILRQIFLKILENFLVFLKKIITNRMDIFVIIWEIFLEILLRNKFFFWNFPLIGETNESGNYEKIFSKTFCLKLIW